MATLTADLSVMIPVNGLTLLDKLDLALSLLEDMPQEDRDDPHGSVALSRGDGFILFEDTLYALLQHCQWRCMRVKTASINSNQRRLSSA